MNIDNKKKDRNIDNKKKDRNIDNKKCCKKLFNKERSLARFNKYNNNLKCNKKLRKNLNHEYFYNKKKLLVDKKNRFCNYLKKEYKKIIKKLIQNEIWMSTNFTKENIIKGYEKYDYCEYCSEFKLMTKEHVIPQCYGGVSIIGTCEKCNGERSNNINNKFLNWIFKNEGKWIYTIRESLLNLSKKCKKNKNPINVFNIKKKILLDFLKKVAKELIKFKPEYYQNILINNCILVRSNVT